MMVILCPENSTEAKLMAIPYQTKTREAVQMVILCPTKFIEVILIAILYQTKSLEAITMASLYKQSPWKP